MKLKKITFVSAVCLTTLPWMSAAPPALTPLPSRSPVTKADFTLKSRAGNDEARLKAEREVETLESVATLRLADAGVALPDKTIGSERDTEISQTSVSLAPGAVGASNAPSRRGAGKVKTGTLFAREYNRNSEKNNASQLTMEKTSEGTYSVSNVYGLGGTITISVNESAGTVSITPQIINTHRTYGDLWMCSVDLQKGVYSQTDPITGTIDANGNIMLSDWGIFAVAGSYKDANFGLFTESKWMPVNATISITAPKEEDNKQFMSVVEQVSDNEINVFNIIGNTNYVALRLYPGGSVQMSPQWVFTNPLYGDVCVYNCDFQNSKINYRIPVDGTSDSSSITLGGWVAALRTGTGVALQAVKTVISVDPGFVRFPEATSFALTGSGTQTDPYLLKTAEDFTALSQSVRGGNRYSGKYFALANDVSLSGLSHTYEPIGSEGTPFCGIFDGRGHTVSGLNADGRGFPDVGLFGYLGQGGRIEHLQIKDMVLRSSGATLGAVCSTSYGTVSDCHVSARLVGTGEVMGGIVGQSVGKIDGCSFSGNIDGTGCIAGIAGLNYGQISGCHTIGIIELTGMNSSMYHQAGGIAGQMITPLDSETASITDCYVGGAISDTYGYSGVGGVVCLVAKAKVERCFNAATISSLLRNTENDVYAGGVAAWAQGATIKDCFNAGTIMRTLGTGIESSEMVGGVVGYLSVSYTFSSAGVSINNVSDIARCYNSGQVSAPSTHGHKGIYGDTYVSNGFDPIAMSIHDCWFDNQVNPFDDPQYGRPTSFFTGALPEALDASVWTASSGYYPLLTSMKESSSALLASATLTLDKTENAAKVKKPSVLKAPEGVTWQFYEGDTFSDESESMKITGRVITVKENYGNNLLMARTTDGQIKAIRLAAVPKVFDGDGTSASPYLIKSVADMKRLDEAVSTFAQPHSGDFFRLTTDLDFSGSGFDGIGNSVYGFGGEFDGDGHTVHNFSVDNSSNNYWYGGLFNTALKSSAIRNIHIASDCSLRFFHYSGAVVGYTEGLVDNCTNAAPVIQTGAYGAGIVGMLGEYGTVSRCHNSGGVLASQQGAAGIVALNIGNIYLCQNDADIIGGGTGEAGGIASAHAGEIDRCVNNGTVTSFAYVGGIAGNVSQAYGKGEICNSLNNALVEITGPGTYRGAVAGYLIGSPEFSGNWYDASVNIGGSVASFGRKGVSSASTRELVAGKPLESLSSEDFDFTAGKYPVLKIFAAQPAAQTLRSIHISFAEGESRANLTADADLSAYDGLSWSVKSGANFKINGQKLNVTVPESMEVVNDTITASVGTKFVKRYALRTMPDVLEGKGTVSNPYQIRTPEDLNYLALFMDSTMMEYSDYYFRVMNDIDCSGKDFRPIGYAGKFNGVFDGNGKRIHGVNYENLVYPKGRSIGFFGTIGEKAVVKDLTLEGKISGIAYVGGFAGRLYGTIENCVNRMVPVVSSGSNGFSGGFVAMANSGAVIRNCVNEVSFSSEKPSVGGIAATASTASLIENCVNKGDISSSGNTVGGIVAQGGGTYTGCRNEGRISVAQTAGGIIGAVQGSAVVKDCHNVGTVTSSTGRTLGGIIGSVPLSVTVEISDCSNTADITALSMVGGIVGEAKSGTTMTDCSNSGKITSTAGAGTFTGSAGGVAGQFCGGSAAPSLMTGCYNTGAVSSHADYTGGVAGKVTSATLRDCYNTGDVSATKLTVAGAKKVWETGGICGNNTGPVENCWNAGNVYSTGYAAAGISGLPQANLIGCFNLGDVTVEKGDDHPAWGGIAGGVFGYTASSGEIRDCYNLGNVTAPDYAGGIASGLSGSWTMTNCYNAGKVTGTDEGASHLFEIMGPTSVSVRPSAVSGIFYVKDVNSHIIDHSGYDPYAEALTRKEMETASLGEGYHYERACLPTLVSTAEPAYANLAAVGIEFAEGENELSVKTNVYLGQLEAVEWSASSNCKIIGEKACPTELGEVILTASSPDGKRNRVFRFIATEIVGVDETFIDSDVAGREYFDIQGRQIVRPADGTVCIVRTHFSDGRVMTEKVVLSPGK